MVAAEAPSVGALPAGGCVPRPVLFFTVLYCTVQVVVTPALLHGDLWSGNVAQAEGEPVIFDPASFYGHHEYDLAIGRMFGGFGAEFYR